MKPALLFEVEAFEHVGIRVSDAEAALAFYAAFGFEVESQSHEGHTTYELINANGVRINLVCNARRRRWARNILLDEAVKHPGLTHVAFVVRDLAAVVRILEDADIGITDGPTLEERRRYLFFRDPDGNLIEVNELLPARPRSPNHD